MNLRRHFFLVALMAMASAACTAGPQAHVAPKKHVPEKVKVTADDQMKGNQSDIEITRRIRSRLTDDQSLSVGAQNVTIVTLGKRVTLSGEVRNQKEKDRVLTHARQINGTRTINNQLTYTE